MSSTIQSSHIERFLVYLEQEDFESAYNRAEAFLLQEDIDQDELRQICDSLDSLLEPCSIDQEMRLVGHLLEALQNFPVLAKRQAQALSRYGEICLAKEECLSAMRSFATAYRLDPSEESARKLTAPLLPFVLRGLKIQLSKAVGRADPIFFQTLLTQFRQKFGFDKATIRKIYQIADEVYKEISNPNTKKIFTHCLDEIEDGKEGRLHSEAPPLPYLENLKRVRAGFEEQEEIRVYQTERTAAFRAFFQELFQDALFILGEPPCGYDIRAMGSLAREEVCPYSDFEYFILIEEETFSPYFKKLAELFELQMLSLGETQTKHQELFNFGQKFGLEIDHQTNPANNESLIGTPEKLFAKPQDPSSDDLKAYKSRFTSISILGNHSFPLPNKGDTDFAQQLLNIRREKFDSLQILQGNTCMIKEEFMEPLFHFLGELGLLFGIQKSNTIDLIDALPLFNENSKYLLKTAVDDLYRLRIRLHLTYGGIQEEASLTPSLGLTPLTQLERESLKRIHQLVLCPLYAADLEGEIDLISLVLQRPNRENVALAAPCIQKNHLLYYQLLSSPDHVDLQALFLDHVPSIAHALSEIPNRAGYRQSRRLEEETLRIRLENVTTDESISGVKIRSPLIGDRYLTVEAARILIGGNGHIIRKYKDSLHLVCDVGNLHFKELPYQPLMEYAVYSLWHRIMGKGSPATTLARIEIPSKNLVYPVIISETIEGDGLNPDEGLYSQHLTWLRLCEILTKPGDGRLSNYVVQSGKVYCIDNDISFMEPVVKSFIGRSIAFVSSLFTLDQQLDQEVLQQFCTLEPDLILTDWLEELQRQEELYCALFSPEELKTFYNRDTKRRFSPTLMLAKGTIATLCMQFYHLQDILRETQFTDPSLLLRELISFEESTQNQVGIVVERQYRKALKKPFAKRLEEATATRGNQTMTSEKAMRLNYKKIPTFEEIQERKTYSLEEASNELCLLEAQKLWNQVFVIQNREEYSIEADFSTLQDPEREKLILRALQYLYDTKKEKPRILTLRHTSTLTPVILRSLLHPELRSLDLSYGTLVSENSSLFGGSILSEIHAFSPELEELYLEGCSALKEPTITLSSLRRFNISHCANLTTLRIENAQLQELKINHSPKLKTLGVFLTMETEVDWKETPNLAKGDFAEEFYQFGKQYADGEDVPQDFKRALMYWNRAAASGHKVAQTILSWRKYMDKNSYLFFPINRIGDTGRKALGEALKTNKTLISLDLSGNQIADWGSVAIGEALKINQTLKSLNLRNNQIGVLYERIRDLGWETIIEALKFNQTLTSLDLSINKFGDWGGVTIGEALKTNKTLTFLNLEYNKIGNQGGVAIGEALKTNQTLKSLDLNSNKIGNQGGVAIGEALKINQSLTTLNLSFNRMGEQGGIAIGEALKTNKTLTSLYLNSNHIGEQVGVAIGEALKINQTLTTLNLSFNRMGEQGGIAIGEALKTNKTLSFLYLSSNHIGEQGGVAIGEALKTNKILTFLYLGSNHIGEQGGMAIGEALKTNQILTSLYLDSNQIGEQGGMAIGEALKTNKTLTTLDLHRNQIGVQGGVAIGKALKTNKTLTTLDLHRNQIEEQELNTIKGKISKNESAVKMAFKAAKRGDNRFVELLEQGVSLYSHEFFTRNTFLHLAASHGHLQIVQILRERAKDPTFPSWKNMNSRTAHDLAQENGHTAIVEFLTHWISC